LEKKNYTIDFILSPAATGRCAAQASRYHVPSVDKSIEKVFGIPRYARLVGVSTARNLNKFLIMITALLALLILFILRERG